MKYLVPVSMMVVASLIFALSGCTSQPSEPVSASPPSTMDGHGDHDHGEHDHGDHAQHDESEQSDMEKMKAELVKLSEEDAASAEKQHFCPVSGEMLGTMGAPQKIGVGGEQVWICCAGCKDRLLENPDEYLAKLKN